MWVDTNYSIIIIIKNINCVPLGLDYEKWHPTSMRGITTLVAHVCVLRELWVVLET